MDVVTTQCDYCGRLKMTSNRWWKLLVFEQGYAVLPAEAKVPKELEGLVVKATDMCGESCLQATESAMRDRW
jgi:hypothetical protein